MTNVESLHKVIKGEIRGRGVGKTHAHLELLIGHLESSRYINETYDIKDFYFISLRRSWREYAFHTFIHLLESKEIPFEKLDRWVVRVMDKRVIFDTVQQMSRGRHRPMVKSFMEVDVDYYEFNEDGSERPVRLIGNGFARQLWDEQKNPPEKKHWVNEPWWKGNDNIIDWPEL
jgi:hypothetical protein